MIEITLDSVLGTKPKQGLIDFIEQYKNIRNLDSEFYIQKTNDLIKYYKRAKGVELINPLQKLEDRWFNALAKNEIDYGTYADEDYFIEVWACWTIYSRIYLRNLCKVRDKFTEPITTVLDLGNGIGKSTAALTEMFPKAKVTGTNLKISEQWNFCEELQKEYNFDLTENISNLGKVDFIFASEYFEHILNPLSHIQEIIDNNQPTYMVIANSFGTVGIGHFKEYNVNGEIIYWKKISKRFRTLIKENGYKKMKLGFFNDTPNVWKYEPSEKIDLEEW